jgi:hypothetical protein
MAAWRHAQNCNRLFGPLAGNPTINYAKTYATLSAVLRTMMDGRERRAL